MNELDKWFPRKEKPKIKAVEPEQGIIDGVPRHDNWKKPRKKRDPHKVTAKQLERIGEKLTQYVFDKLLNVSLRKIPLVEGYYGFKSIDVDFLGSYGGRPLKVEAKTWWIARNGFPLSRFSDNERMYMQRGLDDGFLCWIAIAVLRDRPKRSACNELYVLSWSEWLNIEQTLAERASGNFKGRSMRKRDIDLLNGYAITRNGRQWEIPNDHPLSVVKQN